MVSGLKGTTYKERLKELYLSTLEERRVRYDMVETFKILNGFDDVSSDMHGSGKLVRSQPERQDSRPITRTLSEPDLDWTSDRISLVREWSTPGIIYQQT